MSEFSDRFGKLVFLAFLVAAEFALVCSPGGAIAQDSLPPPPVLQNPATGGNLERFFSSKTPYEFWLTCLIGTLGLTIIAALIFGLRRINHTRPEDITRPVIVLTVIMGTLILVTAGYSNEQIAPAFGLFGTIVGYMLGRLSQSAATASAQVDRQHPDGGNDP